MWMFVVVYRSKTFLLGLFAAVCDLNIEFVTIKGVSDFADGGKSSTGSWKLFSSVMAASLTAHILGDPIAFKDLPHYGGKY